MPNRRNIILGVGGALALVGAGAAWRVMRVPQTAYRPWEEAGRDEIDPRLDAFRHALLAPNPHNMQPWQIRLIGSEEVIITCDLERRLPQTDPLDRQIVIGFGCFIELARIAASRRGFRVETQPFPQGAGEPRLDRRPVAHLLFVRDPQLAPDPLAAFIRQRRSSKVAFDPGRNPPEPALAALRALARDGIRLDHTRNPAEAQALRELAIAAFTKELRTARTLGESIDVLRVGAGEIDANPDGIPLQGPLFEALGLLGPERVRADARNPDSGSTTDQIGRWARLCEKTPAFIWQISRGNSRLDQLAAGGAYLRLNLTTASLGLALHPVSQALQEYPEMANLYAEARKLCGVEPGETLQMFARLGYAGPVGPAPRWPLEAKLIRT